MTRDEVVARLRLRVDEAGGAARWAALAGVSRTYVQDVLQDRRQPGDAVLEALGLRKLPSELRYEEVRT